MQKKISILIVPDDGKMRKYVFSERRIKIFIGIIICIVGGIIWFAFQYGNLISKDMKIRVLEARNKELMDKSSKLILFEDEFNVLKSQTTKIANMLGVQYSEIVALPKKQSDSGEVTTAAAIPNEQNAGAPVSLPDIPSGTPTNKPSITGEKKVPCIYPVEGVISQKFSSEHSGVDFAAKFGAEVLSTMDGEIAYAGWDETFGYIVRIKNDNGYMTVYGHLSKFKVEEGNTVRCGDLIGFVGSTGRSSAPHLHYEVLLNGTPQNPENFLGNNR